jgi:two-component system response regulator HydG
MSTASARILILGDEAGELRRLADKLRGEGHECRVLTDASRLPVIRAAERTEVLLVDVRGQLPEWGALTGVALADDPAVPVILITDAGSASSGVRAVEEGVFDVLSAPLSVVDLHLAIQRARRYRSLLLENRSLRGQATPPAPRLEVVGSSPAIRLLLEKIRAVAATDSPILITGEQGSGKARIAEAIHDYSPRRDHPFMAVDCAAIESDRLFCGGPEPTPDDMKARRPVLREASRGTLFLENIVALEPTVQESLVRLIGTEDANTSPTRPADVHPRIVTAATEDLEAAVEQGAFRRDLFDHLSAVQVRLPPLRARGEDLVALAERFLGEYAASAGRDAPAVSPEVWVAFGRHRWPGNVSELKALARHLVEIDEDGTIRLEDLPDDVRYPPTEATGARDLGSVSSLPLNHEEARDEAMRRFRLAYLRRLLAIHDGNVSRAAVTAGVSRRTLHRWLSEIEMSGSDPAGLLHAAMGA